MTYLGEVSWGSTHTFLQQLHCALRVEILQRLAFLHHSRKVLLDKPLTKIERSHRSPTITIPRRRSSSCVLESKAISLLITGPDGGAQSFGSKSCALSLKKVRPTLSAPLAIKSQISFTLWYNCLSSPGVDHGNYIIGC